MSATVRVATLADVPILVELSRQHVLSAPVAALGGFDVPSAFHTFVTAIKSPEMVVFTSGTGYLIGVVTPLPFNSNVMIAQELGWFESAKGGKVMLEAFEEWAKANGAKLTALARVEGVRDEVLDKVYKRYGYRVAEWHYVKEN